MMTNLLAIRALLDAKSFDDIRNDIVTRAALERFFEIICEAARHVPQEWQNQFPEIPRRRVVDLGNQLRHACHHISPSIPWSIYANDLDSLKATLRRMIVTHGPIPERPEDVRG